MYLYSSVKKITLSLRPCFRLDLFRVFTWNHLSVVGIRVPLRHFPSPGNQNYLAAEPSWWLASARHRNLGTKAPNLELHRTLPVVLTTYDTIWFPLFYVISSILWVSSTCCCLWTKHWTAVFASQALSLVSITRLSNYVSTCIYGPFNIQPRKKQELTYIASTLCCCPMQSSPARSWRNRVKFLVNYRETAETGCLYSLGENELLAIKAIYIFHSLNAWEAVRAFTSW